MQLSNARNSAGPFLVLSLSSRYSQLGRLLTWSSSLKIPLSYTLLHVTKMLTCDSAETTFTFDGPEKGSMKLRSSDFPSSAYVIGNVEIRTAKVLGHSTSLATPRQENQMFENAMPAAWLGTSTWSLLDIAKTHTQQRRTTNLLGEQPQWR